MIRACALCGAPAPPPFRAPQPELAPDLDQRPGEPTRSTLARWLQTCGNCGACAPDVTRLPVAASDIAGSDAYRAQPSRFLRWAMLMAGTPAEAEALLQAAWEADDTGRDATGLRRLAAAVWPEPEDAAAALRLVDVLRRGGALTQAAERLASLPQRLDETSQRIAQYQRGLIARGDTGQHLISSALRPPARLPHVAHGKPAPGARGGFWSRLLGL